MESRDRAARVVSPELVLVDPDLAAWARAQLPEHPWPPVPRLTVEARAPSRLARARSSAIGFLAFGFAAAAVLVVLSVLPTPDRPTFAAGPGEPALRAQPEPAAGLPRSEVRPRITNLSPERPLRSRLGRGPLFAWAHRPGVRHYNTLFLRDGKAFYQVQTRVPRVRLPTRIRFTPGSYRWIVRPVLVSGLRVRLGSPIVDATFAVGD